MGAPKGPVPVDTEAKKKLRQAGKEFAKKRLNKIFANSKIEDKSATFPQFKVSEVTFGKVLGKGGFGTVFEVRGFEAGKEAKAKEDDYEETAPSGAMESRQFIAEHCIRKGGDARYAAKMLSPEVIADPPNFIQGIMDMATETRVLSDIEHPNIIKMRACAVESPYEEKFFIVMDRLYDTMERRMDKWAKRGSRYSGCMGALFDSNGVNKRDILEEKLVAAFDLCAAIGHLHSRKILYRDLKPENVGFDIRDDVKIFDFGLAKELTDDIKQDENGLYKLTGMTGSPRYMAPEVANEKPYNQLCDSYSFAILFWQMYSDKTPFEVYGMKSMRERVWNGENKRPFVQEDWPVPIKSLIRRAWSPEISERPNFTQIYKILRNECVRVRDGNADGLEHQRRRSTFVFRGAKGGKLTSTKTTNFGKGSDDGSAAFSGDLKGSGELAKIAE